MTTNKGTIRYARGASNSISTTIEGPLVMAIEEGEYTVLRSRTAARDGSNYGPIREELRVPTRYVLDVHLEITPAEGPA